MYSHRITLVLLALALATFLPLPSQAISVSYSTGSIGGSVTVSENYNLDTSAALLEDTAASGGAVDQTRSLAGSGPSSISQSVSGSNGYSSGSTAAGSESLSISSSVSASPSSMAIFQSIQASGSAGAEISGSLSGLSATETTSTGTGSIATSQSLVIGGGVATSQDTSVAGNDAAVKSSAVSGDGSSFTMSGSASSGTLRASMAAYSSDSVSSSADITATGRDVSFQSSTANPQGTYTTGDTQSSAVQTLGLQQVATASAAGITTAWTRSGSGTIEAISSTYSSTDGTKRVSNSVSGSGDLYNIDGTVTTGQDYAFIYQNVRNVNGNLATDQAAYSDSFGETLSASGSLRSTGTVTGTQQAVSDPSKVFVSQILSATGSITAGAGASASADSSQASLTASGASSLSVMTVGRAQNTQTTEVYHRTNAFVDSYGYASSASADGSSKYAGQYFAKAHGEWTRAATGDLSVSGETVKSATADVELKTASNSAATTTQSGTGTTANSGLWTGSSARSGGDVQSFQSHLYSHAYPANVHHSSNEYVSTASAAVTAKDSDTVIRRWDSSAWTTIKSYTSGQYTTASRASDITTSGGTWDRFWEVPPRSSIPSDRTPWGIEMMYGRSLTATSGGQGADVAIIDTGADVRHPDLLMRVEDFADSAGPGEEDTNDADGHGTHVAGTIVGDGGYDNQGIYGMAPEADLRVYATSFYYSDIAAGIYRATDLGAEIISMSLGGSSDSTALNNALDYAMANGVMPVAAAANGLPSNPTIATPARYSGVVAVGAIDSGSNAIWWSSPGYNDGDYTPEAKEVMFGAPGVGVYSTYKGSSYDTMSGTSMATPHIAGTAASIWSSNLIYGYGAADVKELMQLYARKNDVTTVKVTPESTFYKTDIADNAGLSGAPGSYYRAIQPYATGSTYYLKILQGDDCLTGFGIPKIPAYGSIYKAPSGDSFVTSVFPSSTTPA